ncbi:MAG: MBL fold metallo-hydrolase [Acholeplasma sp.]|jgi:glyoxylase-like metal-dependent hydrolase (beta-lactamase superfamily II)|nr:MAG: MBL fold metallo-hydrolase [Acholeplasma sp.]
MLQIKGNDDLSHVYILCRFNQCLIIDPSHSYDEIIHAVGERTISGILLTHAHADHVDLIGHFDVPIYLHSEDAHLLFEDQYNGYAPKAHPYKRKQLNFIFVNEGEKIMLADHVIDVFYTPGHTKGGLSFLYDQKLFTGDTLFKEDVGRHDLYSGNLVDLRKSILKLLALSGNIKVYPGHDDPTTIRHEQKNNPYYLKWSKMYK